MTGSNLKLYNTRTRKKDRFEPIDAENVRMYVCGPTVYDFAHIGNARPIIVFDVLFRLLRHIYGESHVTYVRNITDVDDKINARAAEEGVPIEAVTERTIRQFHDDIGALGVLEPTVEPRATEHITQMKAMIETLVEKGCAYVAADHVLFRVASMPDYGKLSGRSLEEMEAGARVEVAPYKQDPMDFVLWKPSREGEPAWPSPCGIEAEGRPGWHIECSAMADQWLWEQPRDEGRLTEAGLARPHVFDIHGGGIDLQFPHHENEVAQSRCAHGTEVMANVWMHNGFLQVEGEKMSKSLGNFVTIRDLLEEWPGEAVRLAMLMTHYRKPLNFSKERLINAKTLINEVIHALRNHDPRSKEQHEPFINALMDDLNTHSAIDHIRTFCKESRSIDGEIAVTAKNKLAWSMDFLGFEKLVVKLTRVNFERDSAVRSALGSDWDFNDEFDKEEINKLIAARNAARKAKNFAEADRIRDELVEIGIQIKDGKDPETGEPITTWEVAR